MRTYRSILVGAAVVGGAVLWYLVRSRRRPSTDPFDGRSPHWTPGAWA